MLEDTPHSKVHGPLGTRKDSHNVAQALNFERMLEPAQTSDKPMPFRYPSAHGALYKYRPYKKRWPEFGSVPQFFLGTLLHIPQGRSIGVPRPVVASCACPSQVRAHSYIRELPQLILKKFWGF